METVTEAKILIVHDDPDFIFRTVETLRKARMPVLYDATGDLEGFHKLIASKRYDLILAAYRLPFFQVEDALELLEIHGEVTPVILLSELVPPEEELTLLFQKGVVRVVSPAQIELLPEAVQEALEQTSLQRRLRGLHRAISLLLAREVQPEEHVLEVAQVLADFLRADGWVTYRLQQDQLLPIGHHPGEIKPPLLSLPRLPSNLRISLRRGKILSLSPEDLPPGLPAAPLLWVPLTGNEEVLALILLLNPSPLSLQDRATLEDLLRVAGTALLTLYLGHRIRRAKQEWQALLDAVPDPIALIGPDLKIRRGNQALARITGLQVQDLPGRTCSELFHGGAECPHRIALKGDPPTPLEVKLPNLPERTFVLYTHPVIEENRVVGMVHLLRDISDIHLAQNRLIFQGRLLSISALASGIAHEINNPLTVVLGMAELLSQQVTDPETLDLVRRILAAGRQAAEVIGLLMEFAERQRIRERAPADLNRLIHQTLSLVEGLYRKHHIRIERALGQIPEVVVHAGSVQQALLNLLHNALMELTETRVAKEGLIRIRTYAKGGHVVLQVEDNGPGVPPEIRDRIFDPFFTTRPPGKGYGLGLFMVYAIMREHGGRVEVDESPLGGAAFRLYFPLQGLTPKEAPRIPLLAGGRRVLLLIPDPEERKRIAQFLEQLEHQTAFTDSPATARAEILTGRYDVLIVDLDALQEEAPAFFEEFLRKSARHTQRIIALTSSPLFPEVDQILSALNIPLLVRPVDLNDLARVTLT